ncbi:MAG: hypothetical protein NZ772_02170 [Cyanobacteria bacterium]|nr:hypothetical protein [Cyanobacteriota bacterium]MDW8199948.1 hypothetical protein [Cyanobacteriota bacterium SKYGB_h_bin112]
MTLPVSTLSATNSELQDNTTGDQINPDIGSSETSNLDPSSLDASQSDSVTSELMELGDHPTATLDYDNLLGEGDGSSSETLTEDSHDLNQCAVDASCAALDVSASDGSLDDSDDGLESGDGLESEDEPGGALQLLSLDVTDIGEVQPAWRWSMVWMGVLLVFANVGAAAFLWIRHLPEPTDCKQLSGFVTDRDRLVCANKLAQSGRLRDLLLALDVVQPWTTDHPLYPEALRLKGQWSQMIMNRARNYLYRNDLRKAVMIARQVPPTSPIYQEAQATIAVWQRDWDKGYDLHRQAVAAIKARQWAQADLIARRYVEVDNDYWRSRLSVTLQQISLDEVDWNRLRLARQLASSGDPRRLVNAITAAQQISPQGHFGADARADIDQWSQKLLAVAIKEVQRGKFAEAATIADAIPDDSVVGRDARRLLQVARSLASLNSVRVKVADLPTRLWEYSVTLQLASQVQSDQTLYQVIRDRLPALEHQFEDMLTLQSAILTSTIRHPIALRLAVDKAKQIEKDRPLRPKAQAKAAEWNSEILRIQARPYLEAARRLAAEGTLDAIKAAIAKADKIPTNHPLYGEAQAAIRQYRTKLEILRDNGILEQVKALALSKKFTEALVRLDDIQPDRPLYQDAEVLRQDILTQLQISEDQPILDQANTLAKAQNYTEAINLADQISPDRALYSEAQALISRWLIERDSAISESDPQTYY